MSQVEKQLGAPSSYRAPGEVLELVDIQSSEEGRGVPIESVGIDRVRSPIYFNDGTAKVNAIASCEVSVALPAEHRGTHMSRMISFLNEVLVDFDPRECPAMLRELAWRMRVDSVSFGVGFPFATAVAAPASGLVAHQVHEAVVRAELRNEHTEVATTVRSEVTSLCPCSKAVSDYGAHNQRSEVTLTVRGSGGTVYPMTIADLASEAALHGSAPVVPLVKRQDERVLTMQAYERPKFVEDIVRDASLSLRSRKHSHTACVRNLESIHSHDAVARIDWSPPPSPSPVPPETSSGHRWKRKE